MAPQITIIVLNWNNAPDTLTCLASLDVFRYANFRVVVVDNGSDDGSAERIAKARPDIDCIRLPENSGFCTGNNRGIEYAMASGAEFILLLNNDTTVDPGMLDAFQQAYDTLERPGFLGAKIYYAEKPDTIWLGMPKWDPHGCTFSYVGDREIDDGTRFSVIEEVDYVCGCAIFFHRSLVESIGFLDDKLFCYVDEQDWCWRARRAGYRHYFVPDAKVWHKVSAVLGGVHAPGEGARSPVSEYFRARNTLEWARLHLRGRQRRTILWRHTLGPFLQHVDSHASLVSRLKRVYWNMRSLSHDPHRYARALGARDFYLRRFGNAPRAVKALTIEMSPAQDPA